jgi:signal transduction protein with GAF and PtsI domain
VVNVWNSSQSARSASRNRRGRFGALLGVLALLLGALAACGEGDGGESAQQKYCDAGAQLRTSLTALADVDLLAEGTNGVKDAVDQVQTDFDALRDAATDATQDEVDALSQALDELDTAMSDLGGELTSENAVAVKAAIQNVGTAAKGVYDTLADC